MEGNRTGVGRYLFNLLREWQTAGREKQIADCRFILYFKDEIPADLPKSDLFEMKLLKTLSKAWFIHRALPRAAKKDKIDILFCPAYVAPLCYRGKIALTLHDIVYEAHPEWFNWQSKADKILLRWVSKKAAKKAAIIFVPSEFTRQEVIKNYRVPSEKVVLTYEAVDSSLRFLVKDEKALASVKNKYALKEKFIFFAGSIFSRRHIPEIIETFSKFAQKRGDFQLLLCGKNYTSPWVNIDRLIEQKNSALGRQAILRVDFVADNELKLLYNACAFFVWLSDYEGFGLPPLEAMSCGAPVISSDSSSLREVINGAGLLIKNNSDTEEICQAMQRLAEDDVLRAELIRKGSVQAVKFSWQECAEKTLQLLISNINV